MTDPTPDLQRTVEAMAPVDGESIDREADAMVRTLLDEIDRAAPAWEDMVRVCAMISNIRFRQKAMQRKRENVITNGSRRSGSQGTGADGWPL